MTSAQYWRNVFDPSTGFMRARLNGRWVTPFDPREVNNHFTEGNSWQYSFFVPHDVVGLMRAYGGPEGLCTKLDSLFSAPEKTHGRTQADITGQIGQYAHGNEPSHHIPYLYTVAGHPEKTKQIVDRIMNTLYSSAPDGLCGNDDCGQMSAWYVLSALGKYPICPGAREGEVTYVPKTIIVNPAFEMDNDIFEDSVRVSITNVDLGCRAMYRVLYGTAAGSDSTAVQAAAKVPFKQYSGPFTLRQNARIEAYSEHMDGRHSFTVHSSVHKIHNDMKVTLLSRYNPQYSAGGDSGLIDNVRGTVNWRTGGWQGYQDTDFTVIVDLLENKSISQIGAGFLQDARSWIWMPQYVEYSVSADGKKYVDIGRVDTTVDPKDYNVQTWDYAVDVEADHVRYVKIHAKNFGTIPEWPSSLWTRSG